MIANFLFIQLFCVRKCVYNSICYLTSSVWIEWQKTFTYEVGCSIYLRKKWNSTLLLKHCGFEGVYTNKRNFQTSYRLSLCLVPHNGAHLSHLIYLWHDYCFYQSVWKLYKCRSAQSFQSYTRQSVNFFRNKKKKESVKCKLWRVSFLQEFSVK